MQVLRSISLIIFGLLGIAVLCALIFEQIRYVNASIKVEHIAEVVAEEKVPDIPVEKPMDPWGSEFKLERADSEVRVISAGPDKILNTKDDIKSRWVKRRRKTDLD